MSYVFNAMHAIILLHMHVTLATHAKKLKRYLFIGNMCVWVNYMLAVRREVNNYYCSSLTCVQYSVIVVTDLWTC